ncbi:MAG: hypothetical protein H6667_17200 [Ardenticatenaceae bacterium]|nr:hypothetical protein [Ardenticatenaceae bacterium]MCB9443190.1 hypothetical protein [Ardenticatenaceae bacterium]
MGKAPQKWLFIIIGVWTTAVLLAACNSNKEVAATAVPGEPTLNPTQQAIADMLTYQAKNPRPTRTPDPWINMSKTATAEIMARATAVPTLNATQEAIAAILTYQAENPRPTSTRWVGANLAMTAQAQNRQTPTPSPTIGPTATPTLTPTPPPRTANITIPAAAAPQLDGRFSSGEWDNAAHQTITVSENVKIKVYVQRDATNLYAAFDGLNQGKTALFPELLLDTGFDSNLTWNENDFWFHVSTNVCQGRGPEALWQQCGAPDGWQATDFSQSLSTIEMKIPYELVGVQPGTDQPIAMSWAVMQLSASDEEEREFWPATAVFDQPATWAKGTAVGGW